MKRILKMLVPLLIVGVVVTLIFHFVFQDNDFYYAGTLESTKVEISSQVASTISKIYFQEGDSIKEGEALVELSCEDIKNNAALAKANYERYKKLASTGSASPETLDNIEAKKNDAEIRLSWCVIKSPLNGQVVSRYHEPGEWMNPGSKILSISNSHSVWAYIYVPQNLISKLSVGMKVKAYLPEMNFRVFEGIIKKINEEAEFTPKNVQTREERTRLVFGVKVGFEGSNSEGILKPGMSIEVDLP